MNRPDLDLLMTTMIACMDELDPEATVVTEGGNPSAPSPVSDEEIICHWMVDLWSQIDQIVVDETAELQQLKSDNRPPEKSGSARQVAELSIEMGLPDLASLALRRSGASPRTVPRSRSPRAQFSWCLFPGSYNGVMDIISRRC